MASGERELRLWLKEWSNRTGIRVENIVSVNARSYRSCEIEFTSDDLVFEATYIVDDELPSSPKTYRYVRLQGTNVDVNSIADLGRAIERYQAEHGGRKPPTPRQLKRWRKNSPRY